MLFGQASLPLAVFQWMSTDPVTATVPSSADALLLARWSAPDALP